MKKKEIDAIVEAIAKRFRCFGGGIVNQPRNPVSHWMKNEPYQFALGVDVREVVEFAVRQMRQSEGVGSE